MRIGCLLLAACSGGADPGGRGGGDDDDAPEDTGPTTPPPLVAILTGTESCPVQLGTVTVHDLSADVVGEYSIRCDYVDGGAGKELPAVTLFPEGGSRDLVRIDHEPLEPGSVAIDVSHFCSVPAPYTTTCEVEVLVGLDGEPRLFTVDVGS